MKAKIITVFSGKGGVGKSTVSSLLALEMSSKYKTALLDFDINTPSIPVLFGNRVKVKNLDLYSTGFNNKGALNFGGRSAKSVLTEMTNELRGRDYEVIIIDMPPGASSVHTTLMTKLKPSGLIAVTQPNNLSKEDTVRAIKMFMDTNIPLLGIIYNMVSKTFGETANLTILDKLYDVPLDDYTCSRGNEGRIDDVINPFRGEADKILSKIDSVKWSIESVVKHSDKFKGLPLETVKEMFEYHGSAKQKLPKFYGLDSWEWAREILLDLDYSALGVGDRLLRECTTEKLSKILSSFDEDGFGLFCIIKSPWNHFVTGEIGYGRLDYGDETDSYYGLPRITYQSDKGEHTFFAHEITPVNMKYITELVEDGELIKVKESVSERWVPAPKYMNDIFNQFGLSPDWVNTYKELGIDVSEYEEEND